MWGAVATALRNSCCIAAVMSPSVLTWKNRFGAEAQAWRLPGACEMKGATVLLYQELLVTG